MGKYRDFNVADRLSYFNFLKNTGRSVAKNKSSAGRPGYHFMKPNISILNTTSIPMPRATASSVVKKPYTLSSMSVAISTTKLANLTPILPICASNLSLSCSFSPPTSAPAGLKTDTPFQHAGWAAQFQSNQG